MLKKDLNTLSLKDIIFEFEGEYPSISKLYSQTDLSKSTLNDALRRPIEKTSFGVVLKILNAKSISLDKVSERLNDSKSSPEIEEQNFIENTNEKDLSIMGVQFSSKENFWKTRESITSSIYEGFHPTKQNVLDSYQILEEHIPVEKLVNDLLNEYREN